MKLNLADGERVFLEFMHALAVDSDGNEVLCGLSISETREYLALVHRLGDLRIPAERDRYLELHDKHEETRKRLLIAHWDARESGHVN